MSETEKTSIDKSESSSFEDLASAAAHEIEEAKLAAAAAEDKDSSGETLTEEWQDLLGSGSLLKKVIKDGDDSEGLRPSRSDICRISYEVKIKGSEELVEKREHVKIYLGDNEVLQGMDIALKLMYKGEECILQMDPRFAYGEMGLKSGDSLSFVGELLRPTYNGPIIGPDTWVVVRLELHDWTEEPDLETLPIAERMEIGIRRRVHANWLFSRGQIPLALQLYRRALDVLDESEGGISDPTPTGEMASTSDSLLALLDERHKVYNNMAAAQFKAGAYEAALQSVSRVLMCEPENVKALYRKSMILSAMGHNPEALEAARAAATVAPEDSGARKALQRCEQMVTRDRSVERKLAKRMLGNISVPKAPSAPDKKPNTSKMLVWGSLLLSLLVGVASVLVYRYKMQH